MKSKEIDILHGPLLSSILRYSLPVMLGSLIQVLFNAADLMVVGQMGSEQSVAAIGATAPIVGLLVTSFVGLSGGTNIILARYLGGDDRENAHKTVDTSMIASVGIGLILTVVGILFAGDFLRLTACPDTCFEDSKSYLILYFSGIPAIMLYNFGSSIIRVTGDSKRPLYYLIASGLLNVVLNVIFCLILERKVLAVGIATLASQCLGAGLVTLHIARMTGPCHMDLRALRFDGKILGKILRYGAPCALTTSLYALSNLQIQSAINAYGDAGIAGSAAASSIEGMVVAFTGSFGVAALAFIGQNLGAGNSHRVRSIILYCLSLGIGFGLVLGLGLYALGRPLLGLYVPGREQAVEYGLIRMKYILAFYAVASVNTVLVSSQQAFGHSAVPMLTSVLSILGVRVLWMAFVYPNHMTYDWLFLCYTVTWCLSMLVHIITFGIIFIRYRHGHVKAL